MFPLPVNPSKPLETTGRIKELEMQLRGKDGKIASLEGLVDKMKREAKHTIDALTDMKMQCNEMEKKVNTVKSLEEEVNIE